MDDKYIRAAVMGATVSVMGAVVFYIEHWKSRTRIPREPHIYADNHRQYYINSLLFRGDRHCVEQLRMKPIVFKPLCDILTSRNLLIETQNMSIREQVMIFLIIMGHNKRFSFVSGIFYRSVETVHRYFCIVLKAVLKLHKYYIRSPDNSIAPEIRNNPRFYPYFKDCIGAIDGCHIQAKVPLELQGKFRGRKGITQNVLAAITFDLKFTYILAGWEGSAHDSRVLDDVLSRSGGLKIPEGKCYLGDAGYGLRNGILTPFQGVRYHLKEFTNHGPETAQELFNLRHSSLRTTIERGFGLLKGRFRAIDSRPFWSFKTQMDVVLASCIIHNHIMGVDPDDFIMEEVIANPSTSQGADVRAYDNIEESNELVRNRDTRTFDMWDSYYAR